MENKIKIEHEYTSFFKRVKYHLFILLGTVSLFGLFSINHSNKDFLLFISAVSLVLGFITVMKIYRNKFYLVDFASDSKKINVIYFNITHKCLMETSLENVAINFRNTSSRAGFNCEVILDIHKIRFTITKDFDWNFNEMKNLFEYIKFHKGENLTENEKNIISSINNYLDHTPF